MRFRRNRNSFVSAIAAICALAFMCAVLLPGNTEPTASQPVPIAEDTAASEDSNHSADASSFDSAPAEDEGDAQVAGGAFETLHDDTGAEYVANTVLVGIPAGVSPDQAVAIMEDETGIEGLALAEGQSNDATDTSGGTTLVELSIPSDVAVGEAAARIEASSAVDSVQPNYVYHINDAEEEQSHAAVVGTLSLTTQGTLAHGLVAQATSVDDSLVNDQWGLESMYVYGDETGVGNAWDVVQTDGAVTIAVIDEGFQANHPDLKANVVATRNVVEKSSDVSEYAGEDSHGTHVAGIAGAVANNGKGIAGVSYNAQLLLIKVMSDSGKITSSSLVNGVNYAINNKAKYNVRVINMSIGGGVSSMSGWADDALIKAIDRATAAGIVVVCSAGNSYTDSDGKTWAVPYIDYPADYKNVVSVINLNYKKSDVHNVFRYSQSNYNLTGVSVGSMPSGKNISAPGTSIVSTVASSAYDTKTGTSMSAPAVAGAFALMFAKYPDLTVSEAVSQLYSTATDITSDGSGWDKETGFGEVNAYALVSKEGYLSGEPTVQVGKSITLTPSEAGSWTWKTSSASIATVSNGTVTGKSAGTVRITATRATDEGTETLRQVISVYDPKISGASSVQVGSTTTLTVEDSPSGGWVWSSSNTAVAKVNSNGVVTGVRGGGSATITAKLQDNASISVSKKIKVTKKSLASATVTVDAQLYTGKALKPAPTVKLSGTTLTKGTDYTVTYKNNKKVGTATVIIKGAGNYKGTAKATFRIVRKPTCSGATRVPVGATATYTVKNGSIAIKSGKTYATLSGKTLRARKKGTVVLSIRDAAGIERATKKVKVYALSGTWELRSAVNKSYALDIAEASAVNGANAQVYRANSTTAQRFRFSLKSDGTFSVRNVGSGKVLDVAGASHANKANVQQWTWNATDAQRWLIKVDASNRIKLVNAESGRALSLAGSKAANKRNVWQYTSKNVKSQKWVLQKV